MEDKLLAHLAAGEQVLYRAPRGGGRLNRRVLTLQALAGLMVFITVSLLEGHWSVETVIIFGGIIGLQVFQYLAYDFAITENRVIWFANRWFGQAETVWLEDIGQVDLVWNPCFPALQLSGEFGELLTTGNFPDVRIAADRLVTLCRPKRSFVPSEKLMGATEACVSLSLLMIILAILAIAVTFIAKMAAAEGFFSIAGYLLALILLIPLGLVFAGCVSMLLSAIFLRRMFANDPMDVLLYLGRDPRRPGLEGKIERAVARVCAIVFTIGLARRVRYDPAYYERVRYS